MKKKGKTLRHIVSSRSKFITLAKKNLSYATKSDTKYRFLYVVLLRYFDKLVIHLGHQKVDRIVKFIVNQLKKVANSPSDIIGIVSERKFFILKDPGQSEIGNLQEFAESVASRIIELVSRGVKFGGKLIQPSVNIGISIFPKDSRRIDELIKSAELALEGAEKKGGNTFSISGDGAELSIGRGRRILDELYEAIRSGKMYMVFQPIVDLKNGMRIKMIELLLRWYGQDIGPEKIISISEELGISRVVNEFIFGKLSEISRRLHKYCFSFNILPQHLTTSFVKSIIDNVKRYNIQAERIYLEISEKARFEEIKEFLKNIELLRKVGFRFIIDDFGSSSSIISHIKDIPAEIVKIDKSVIKEAGSGDNFNRIIIQGIVQMVKGIGKKICAEGIETKEELELVRDFDFDFAQGFLFSPPVTEEELLVL